MNFKDVVVNAFRQTKKALLCAVGCIFAYLGLGFGYKYLLKPKKVTHVGVVSQLIIHPLKSGKGLSVTTAECWEMGLKYGELKDRHWLVITEDGHQVTGLQEPRLVLVSMTIEGGELCLNGPGMEEQRIPLQQPGNAVANCRVWRTDVQGRDCGDQASLWISRFLDSGKTFRLVQFESHMKPRRPTENMAQRVAYSDIGAVMLLSEASVTDLNTRLERDVTVAQFRPNVVVSDCAAYAEDSWDEIQIGNVRLSWVMSCGRCNFTKVNAETAIVDSKQPLEALKSYRLCDPSEKHIYKSSPLFGQYYRVSRCGVLKVGDPVYRISY
ncbi:mitochondrial amidoxime-reducing component 1-like [Megalops cyprinoides]|uniref:mitochondrial amidoxime-reducing component 1-like n=1 Tax=Megalops cyprinoides TaxID=118141 RepID=UPI0018653C9B|nr:mitochondrial amidoxime-reducing component 1-like [Megalops cyprinoides]